MKQKLKHGYEWDLIYAKKYYCYLQNNNKLVRFIKRSLRKRKRILLKKIDENE